MKIGNDTNTTNKTKTTVKKIDPKAAKEVLTSDGQKLDKEIEPGDKYKYGLDFTFPQGDPYKEALCYR